MGKKIVDKDINVIVVDIGLGLKEKIN